MAGVCNKIEGGDLKKIELIFNKFYMKVILSFHVFLWPIGHEGCLYEVCKINRRERI